MRTSLIALTAVALFGLTTSLHAQNLNENFDELTPALSATSVGAFQTINGTTVDIVGPGLYSELCTGPESGSCIDIDGTAANSIGQLRSTQLFSAGTYQLSFDLIGNERGSDSTTTVTFGNYDTTFTLASDNITAGVVSDAVVTLTTPGYLLFASNDTNNDQQGTALDNVVVTQLSSSVAATPEPSSLVLLGTGVLSVAGALRKRFVK